MLDALAVADRRMAELLAKKAEAKPVQDVREDDSHDEGDVDIDEDLTFKLLGRPVAAAPPVAAPVEEIEDEDLTLRVLGQAGPASAPAAGKKKDVRPVPCARWNAVGLGPRGG